MKNKTAAEKKHLSRVASLGCIAPETSPTGHVFRCNSPANCHHIRDGQGMGQRAGHFEVLPLCHYHHQGQGGIHAIGRRRWEAKHGTERALLAATLAEVAALYGKLTTDEI